MCSRQTYKGSVAPGKTWPRRTSCQYSGRGGEEEVQVPPFTVPMSGLTNFNTSFSVAFGCALESAVQSKKRRNVVANILSSRNTINFERDSKDDYVRVLKPWSYIPPYLER